jgi:post-segregation antitoxin (ccd killing protein)
MLARTMLLVIAMLGAAHAEDAIFRCPPTEAPAAPSADDARWPLFAKVMPTARGCIDGEVIGVLVAYSGRVQSAIGSDGVYELAKDKAGEPVYKLGVGHNRLRQAQLPAPPGVDETIMLDGNGQNVISRSGEVKLSQGKAHKLVADAHLVKIRVNGGRGSAPKEFGFHGDQLEILDRTKAYPLDVSRLLHATLERFASERRGPEWREQIKKATAKAVRTDLGAKVAEFKQRSESLGGTYFTSWLPDTKRLRIVFYGRFVRELRKPLPAQPGAKKRQVELRTYAAELAYEVEFDATGKRVAEIKHPVSVNPVRTETESTY